ncbi:MAG: OsmC family protein [Chloroflexi bacterium]|nr:OsmC family protein [Chloroflexota bacterium]
MDVPIEGLDMELRAIFPMAEKYGLGDGGAAMEELVYTLNVTSPAPLEQVRALVQRAERYCHASQSLQQPVPVTPLLRVNGEDVPLG